MDIKTLPIFKNTKNKTKQSKKDILNMKLVFFSKTSASKLRNVQKSFWKRTQCLAPPTFQPHPKRISGRKAFEFDERVSNRRRVYNHFSKSGTHLHLRVSPPMLFFVKIWHIVVTCNTHTHTRPANKTKQFRVQCLSFFFLKVHIS